MFVRFPAQTWRAECPLQVLIDESWRGRRWVVETDIANCFSALPREKLMQAIEERVCDQSVLKPLRVILRAGVMEDGQVRRPVTGAPQGVVISPLLCNGYLHRIDRAWSVHEHGVLARFADFCRARQNRLCRTQDYAAHGRFSVGQRGAWVGLDDTRNADGVR